MRATELLTASSNNTRYNVRRVMRTAWNYYNSKRGMLFSECLREAWQDERDLQPYLEMLAYMAANSCEFRFGNGTGRMQLRDYNVWRKGEYCRIYLDLGDDSHANVYVLVDGTSRDDVVCTAYDDDDMPYPFYGEVYGNSGRKRDNVAEALQWFAYDALSNVNTAIAA